MYGKSRSRQNSGAIIRVRGLPFSATASDLVDVMRDFRVQARDVFLRVVSNGPKAGRPDGQAFVKFPTLRVAEQCIEELDGCNMGERYLEMYSSDQEEFDRVWDNGGIAKSAGARGRTAPKLEQTYSAPARRRDEVVRKGAGKGTSKSTSKSTSKGTGKDARSSYPAPAITVRGGKLGGKPSLPEASDDDGIVRVRGLPFSTTREDVVSTFSEYGIAEQDVFMCLTTRGAPDGQCMIRFADPYTAQEVIDTCQKMEMGSRYLELFKSSEEDLADRIERGMAEEGEDQKKVSKYSKSAQSGAYLRLRGLPFSATKRDIVDFFGPSFAVAERDVTFELRGDQKKTGQCFVKLNSEEDAETALDTLNNQNIGDRYVEIFTSSYEEANRGNRGNRGRGRAAPY